MSKKIRADFDHLSGCAKGYGTKNPKDDCTCRSLQLFSFNHDLQNPNSVPRLKLRIEELEGHVESLENEIAVLNERLGNRYIALAASQDDEDHEHEQTIRQRLRGSSED